MGKVIQIHRRRPDRALEQLNRLTGLDFGSWPESLVDRTPTDAREHQQAGDQKLEISLSSRRSVLPRR